AREGATLVVVGADEAPPQPHGRQYAHRTVLTWPLCPSVVFICSTGLPGRASRLLPVRYAPTVKVYGSRSMSGCCASTRVSISKLAPTACKQSRFATSSGPSPSKSCSRAPTSCSTGTFGPPNVAVGRLTAPPPSMLPSSCTNTQPASRPRPSERRRARSATPNTPIPSLMQVTATSLDSWKSPEARKESRSANIDACRARSCCDADGARPATVAWTTADEDFSLISRHWDGMSVVDV